MGLILDAGDGTKSVILRYDTGEAADTTDEAEAAAETKDSGCICSDFNSLKRMMIIFDGGCNQ